MTSEPKTKAAKSSPDGRSSLGCAVVFVIVVVVTVLQMAAGTWEGGELAILFGFPAFVFGNIFGITAIFSTNPAARRAGQRALLLMWGTIVLLVIVGAMDHIFSH